MFIILIIKLNIFNKTFFFKMINLTYSGELDSTVIINITGNKIYFTINNLLKGAEFAGSYYIYSE